MNPINQLDELGRLSVENPTWDFSNPKMKKVYSCTAVIPTSLVDLAEGFMRKNTLMCCTDINNLDPDVSYLHIYTTDLCRTDIVIMLSDAIGVSWNKIHVSDLRCPIEEI